MDLKQKTIANKKIRGVIDDKYIEYNTRVIAMKNYQSNNKHLLKISLYLHDMINMMHSKSHNKEIMIDFHTAEIIEKKF